ncbi:HTTM domain-containing protein [Streptomyces globosus]|uniref:HTTM domain-containing protein n=1 Tax=Streptomyces globosus TaxID=68209 RepID=A0A344U8H0_9ACTN|nr:MULTISPECIES: HTTM domain-containing protein [Streptomyces]AXE27191.1 HTTM domain-containing protein [Streptomyces globosus]
MRRARAAAGRALARATGEALGPYQSAVVRIGFATTWLCFLLREFPHRHELYGPDGPWSWELARRLVDSNHAFTVLLWSDSALWFEAVYALSAASSALLALGWRTRAVSAVFAAGVLSLQNRSVFMGDGGDNVIHLMAIYLVLTRCAQVWSLDARRARRHGSASAGAAGPVLWGLLGAVFAFGTVTGRLGYGWVAAFAALWVVCAVWWTADRYEPRSEARAVLDVLANTVHNAGMLVIAAEVCLIYATAGWYKVQGSRWQDGTALYYPLGLDYFSPWPELSSLLAGSGTLVMLLTYGTVAVQVAFPFTVFQRRVKNVLLAVMVLEHAGIAVLLGLPFFSMAMIAADAVFLPTAFLLWLGARAAGARTGLARRLRRARPGGGPDAAVLPSQRAPGGGAGTGPGPAPPDVRTAG